MIGRILKSEKLRVGVYLCEPTAMKDPEGGYCGLDVDVATRLSADMGVTLEIIPGEIWGQHIPDLLAGHFDIGIANMRWLPKRNLEVCFTQPYFRANITALVSRQRHPQLTDPVTLNQKGIQIVLLRDCAANPVAEKHFSRAEFRLVDTIPELVAELLAHRADALVISEPIPSVYARKHPEQLYVPPFSLLNRDGCMILPPGNPDMLNFLNHWIRTTAEEGWLEERKQYWFSGLTL